MLAGDNREVGSGREEDSRSGILRLRMKTAKLDDLRRYYAQVLEFPLLRDGGGEMTVRAGGTDITFEAVDAGAPYYHFAFNIPENKLAASKRWIAPRCPILKRSHGSDEYHFVAWNAHSIYFLDPAGNILEFIARHNLKNAAEGEFTARDILYASEIALVTDDVPALIKDSKQRLGLEVFANSQSDHFAAVGSDHRLLILVQRGRPWNSGQGRTAEIWPLEAAIQGTKPGRMESSACRYRVETG